MRKAFLANAAIAAGLLAAMPAAAAPEWNTILLEKVVDRTPDQVWAKIGGYCAIQQWLKLNSCVITAGNGVSVGTNRRLNNRIDEIIVAATPHSYTYAQQPSDIQPVSPIFYHGTLAVEPLDGGRKTKIVYTLFYDISNLDTPEKRAADRAQRTQHFGEGLDRMKAMAEAQ
ncbi:MAG TPA: SRPBCC family protein [Rhizomicrobium sp.]|nr:SRPBCC family protein [Rhizomicrobium sp.]